MGRFASPDTIVPDPANPQSHNRYSYVHNSPTNYTDPSGHCIFGIDTIACIAAGGALIGAGIGYGYQVYENYQQGMSFGDALTTDIEVGPIIAGSLLGGAAGGLAGGVVAAAGAGTTASTAATVAGGAATTGAARAACADGECTNEIQTVQTGTHTVYQYVENGAVKYIGITNNFFRRAAEHLLQKGWDVQPIEGLSQLSRADARAVEQVLIEYYKLPNLYNSINSIAITNPGYERAIIRGQEILRQIGIMIE